MRVHHANAALRLPQHERRVEVPSGFSLFPPELGNLFRPYRASG